MHLSSRTARVCGSPPHSRCGCRAQDAVSSGGPLLALIGFMFLPLLWSIPEALVTAELATAFPEDSGYVAWVTAAFGPYWGFQEGFWSWCASPPLQPGPHLLACTARCAVNPLHRAHCFRS